MSWDDRLFEHWRDYGHTWGPGIDDRREPTEEEIEANNAWWREYEAKKDRIRVAPREEYVLAKKKLDEMSPSSEDIIRGKAPYGYERKCSEQFINYCRQAVESMGYELVKGYPYGTRDCDKFSVSVECSGFEPGDHGRIIKYSVINIPTKEDCLQLFADFTALGDWPTVYHKDYIVCLPDSAELRLEMERWGYPLDEIIPKNEIIIRSLNENDAELVNALDQLSTNSVSDMIDVDDYVWGIFLDAELIGYCTIGGADDPEMGYDIYSNWTKDSLLLSDVFVKEEYRNQGYAQKLINEVLEKVNPGRESVFLTFLDNKLESFYSKLGFCSIDPGTMVFTDKQPKREEKYVVMTEDALFSEYEHFLDDERMKDMDGHGYVLDCHQRTPECLIDVLKKQDIEVIRHGKDFYVKDPYDVFLQAEGKVVSFSDLPLEVRIKVAEKEVVRNDQVVKDERGQTR